jgi:Skp family chaperone for outer membrane proteins
MNRLTGAALAVLLAGVAAAPAARAQAPGAPAQPVKLAFINSQLILANTPGRADAESTFSRELVGYQAQVQALQATLDSAVADYNRASLVLSPTAKAQREQQIRDLETRTRSQINDLQQRANAREQQLTAPIMARVQAVIEGVRAEFNYSMIFDASAQNGGLVTADRSLDLTQLVIQRLQAGGTPPPLAPDSGAVAADSAHAAKPDSTRRPRPRPARPQQP